MSPLAYFITFHTYGTWLHGHEGGSVDDDHRVVGAPFAPKDPGREVRELRRMKCPPVELDPYRRFVVDATIREVCTHRRWKLRALHVRSTHVHVVVAADKPPERVLNDFKAYSTRRMREAGVLPPDVEPWSHHGSTRYLNTPESLVRATDYVLNDQGEPLEMKSPYEPRA
jgi:REP element-mobilizing transposase RayT